MFLFLGAHAAQGQEHFSRNIDQVVFVPKGQWVVGLSANYGQSKFDNYQYLVVENINGDNYSFKVSPTLCYMFKDDLGIGGRFAYTRTRTKMNSADFVLSSDDSFSIDNLYAITQTHLYISSKREGEFYKVPKEAHKGFEMIHLYDAVGLMEMDGKTYLAFDDFMLYISTSPKQLKKHGIERVQKIV